MIDFTPIEEFIQQMYLNKKVQMVINNWKVDPLDLMEQSIFHFRDMGVFFVPYGQRNMILENMITHLRHSPEILRMVMQAEAEDLRRRQNQRHHGQ